MAVPFNADNTQQEVTTPEVAAGVTASPAPDGLTPEELANVPEPVIPEVTTDMFNDVIASGESSVAQQNIERERQTEIDRLTAQTQQREDKQTALSSELERLLEDQTSKSARLIEEENKRGVEQGYAQLNQLNTQIATLTAGLNKGITDLRGTPISRQRMLGKEAQIRAQAAAEIGAVTAAAQAVQGNITLASTLAARAVEAEFAPQEQRIQALTSLFDLNYKNLTTAEQKRANLVKEDLEAEQKLIDLKKEERTSIFDIMNTAAGNGADPGTLLKIAKSQTREEAVLNASEFVQEKDKQIIEVNGRKKVIDLNTNKIVADLGAADVDTPKPQEIGTDAYGNKIFGVWNPETSTFSPVSLPNSVTMDEDELTTAVNTAIDTLGLSADQRKSSTRTLNALLKSGDTEAAKSALEALVRNTSGQTEKDKLSAWESSYSALETIKSGLADLEKSGISTGFLTGLTEKQLQKIGETQDTEVAKMKAKVALAIINYRKGVSGAAFTESEGKEYEGVFPSIGKTPELNSALIEGLQEVFVENKDGFIRGRVGAVAYDRIFGNTMPNEALPPLTKSYATVDDLLAENGEYYSLVEDIKKQSPKISEAEILQEIEAMTSGLPRFNPPLSTGGKGLEKLVTGQTELSSLGQGTITGFGSAYWTPGLDFVLQGGKGAPVKLPFAAEVVDVISGYENTSGKPLTKESGKKQNGGFGNQVKVRFPNGYEVWFSHLDKAGSFEKGQVIPPNVVFGLQGNTGMTYGNTGVHLDITAKDPDGNTITAKEVAQLLGDIRLT